MKAFFKSEISISSEKLIETMMMMSVFNSKMGTCCVLCSLTCAVGLMPALHCREDIIFALFTLLPDATVFVTLLQLSNTNNTRNHSRGRCCSLLDDAVRRLPLSICAYEKMS
mmetsp:Transcript_36595/g.76791  ORF Transcript_36595/g.76791 Transcript_36595/m.76791 type:complete len:112 (-) Transcript_36595:31-366(-)